MDKYASPGRYRFYLSSGESVIAANKGNANKSDSSLRVIEIEESQAHHARRVLRLREGAEVEVFDGRGGSGLGKIIGWGNGMQVQIVQTQYTPRQQPRLVVASAVPKGTHAQEMVSQMSQVGVDAWQPMHTARSVVEPGEGKLDRFARMAVESARQCGRAYLMEILPPVNFQKILQSSVKENQLQLIAAMDGQPLPVQAHDPVVTEALVLIGPEGGWTEEEVAQARQSGFVAWGLGPNVLRIETACVAAGTLLRYLLK